MNQTEMNRADLKSKAKEVLKKYYWTLLGISIVGMICTLSFIQLGTNTDIVTNTQSMYIQILMFKFTIQPSQVAIVSGFGLLATILGVLVFSVIQYGVVNVYKYASYDELEHYNIFSGFKTNYKGIVLTKLLKNVFISLWTLLFVIPGIVKTYEYRFVDYILEEHPEWSAKTILNASKKLTYGHKAELFVLDLSFILWYLAAGALNVLTFGLASIALEPYTTSTDVQAYHWLMNLDPTIFDDIVA